MGRKSKFPNRRTVQWRIPPEFSSQTEHFVQLLADGYTLHLHATPPLESGLLPISVSYQESGTEILEPQLREIEIEDVALESEPESNSIATPLIEEGDAVERRSEQHRSAVELEFSSDVAIAIEISEIQPQSFEACTSSDGGDQVEAAELEAAHASNSTVDPVKAVSVPPPLQVQPFVPSYQVKPIANSASNLPPLQFFAEEVFRAWKRIALSVAELSDATPWSIPVAIDQVYDASFRRMLAMTFLSQLEYLQNLSLPHGTQMMLIPGDAQTGFLVGKNHYEALTFTVQPSLSAVHFLNPHNLSLSAQLRLVGTGATQEKDEDPAVPGYLVALKDREQQDDLESSALQVVPPAAIDLARFPLPLLSRGWWQMLFTGRPPGSNRAD